MATIYLAPPTGAIPRVKIDVFNTLLSNAQARGQNWDTAYDPMRMGWLTFHDQDLHIYGLKYDEDICTCPRGRMEIDAVDLWMFELEIIQRPCSAIYWDGTLNENPVQQPSEATRLLICVDNTGLEDHDSPVGEIWVYGQNEDGDDEYGTAYFTEFVPINGPGSYSTEHKFTKVGNCGASLNDNESHCTVSIWGKCGTGVGRRECRVWIDANGDGVYGLVHAGYMAIGDVHPFFGGETITLDLVGYQYFLQSNEYITGYRSECRCANYLKTGESGACSKSSTNFRTSAQSCFIGDLGVRHPNGATASTYCPDFDPGTAGSEEFLPFDGWTYYRDYAPSTETGYEYCPPNYFRAIIAAVNMANSHEINKPVSRKWTMYCKYITALAAEMSTEANIGTHEIPYIPMMIPEYSYIVIGGEVIKVTTVGESGGKLLTGCVRGQMNTLAGAYGVGELVYFPYVGFGTGTNHEEGPLVTMGQLTVPDVHSSIATTLDKLAQTAAVVVGNAEYIAWADKWKAVHFQEMSLDSAGVEAGGDAADLTIRMIDIVGEPRVKYSDVVNQVTARITLADGNVIVANQKAEDIGITGYDLSSNLFGRVTREESNPQLNSYAPVTGKVDFLTWSRNYLKLRAFPVLTQEVCVFGFVPDEHYWRDISTGSELYLPYLTWTDIAYEHVDLRGTKIKCPDFSKPADPDTGEYPMTEWVVQCVSTEFNPPGELLTWITMRRYTMPGDFT